MKQGGVLSPVLFAVFIDGAITAMKKTEAGATIQDVDVTWLREDMAVIAWNNAQTLLNALHRKQQTNTDTLIDKNR